MAQCYFSTHNIKYIDYKDIELLQQFTNPHGRIIAGKRTTVCAKHQRKLAEAIKRARFLGLMPYISR